MNILTLNNSTFNLNDLPEEIEEEIRYNVLNNAVHANPDFFFHPLIFVESFNSPAIVLNIGGNEIQMPLDWNILVGDQDSGLDPEAIPLTSLNERQFDAFVFNPVTGFIAEFLTISIVNIYQDVEWCFPKLRPGHYVTVPIQNGDNPKCTYFIKELSKQSESLNLSLIM